MSSPKNQTVVNGFRFQKYDHGEIHIHDDSKKIKFEASCSDFKKELSNAMSALKEVSDGAYLINGCTNDLLLVKNHNKISFVITNGNFEKDLSNFLNTL